MNREPLAPVEVTAVWLHKPIAPCEMMPDGLSGLIMIARKAYMLTLLGYLPERGEPVISGYRLTQPDGKVYDVDAIGLRCDCPDATFRDRPKGCRHTVAIRQLFRLEGQR